MDTITRPDAWDLAQRHWGESVMPHGMSPNGIGLANTALVMRDDLEGADRQITGGNLFSLYQFQAGWLVPREPYDRHLGYCARHATFQGTKDMATAPNTTKHEEDVAAFKLFLFFSALLIGLIAAGVL